MSSYVKYNLLKCCKVYSIEKVLIIVHPNKIYQTVVCNKGLVACSRLKQLIINGNVVTGPDI